MAWSQTHSPSGRPKKRIMRQLRRVDPIKGLGQIKGGNRMLSRHDILLQGTESRENVSARNSAMEGARNPAGDPLLGLRPSHDGLAHHAPHRTLHRDRPKLLNVSGGARLLRQVNLNRLLPNARDESMLHGLVEQGGQVLVRGNGSIAKLFWPPPGGSRRRPSRGASSRNQLSGGERNPLHRLGASSQARRHSS